MNTGQVTQHTQYFCNHYCVHIKTAEYIQQALQLATTKVQLAILPTFSNEPRKDKTSAAEWLQKLINNKQGAGWTYLQTVTHFRNALRGEVLNVTMHYHYWMWTISIGKV